MTKKIIIYLIMFLVAIQASIAAPATCDGTSPPACDGSTWTVGADTYCHDGNIILCGNLSITSQLSLNNVNLMFNGTGLSNVTQRFLIATNADLYVNNSVFNTTRSLVSDNTTYYYILTWGGTDTDIEIRNTNISQAGVGSGYGMTLFADDLVFINNTVHDVNNGFYDSYQRIYGNNLIQGNHFYNNPGSFFIRLTGDNNELSDNIFDSTNSGAASLFGSNMLIDNNLIQHRVYINGTNITFSNNNFSFVDKKELIIEVAPLDNYNHTIIYNNFSGGNTSYYAIGGNNNYINFSYNTVRNVTESAFRVRNATIIDASYNDIRNIYGIVEVGAIAVRYVNTPTINNNYINNSYRGIKVYQSNQVTINNNDVSFIYQWDNGCIDVDQTNYSDVIGNYCNITNFSAIVIAESNDYNVSNNVMNCGYNSTFNCWYGVIVGNGVNGSVQNNVITDFKDALKIQMLNRDYSSSEYININFTHNRVTNCSWQCIQVKDCNQTIYVEYNEFLNGGNNVSSVENSTDAIFRYNVYSGIYSRAYYIVSSSNVNSTDELLDVSLVDVDASSTFTKWISAYFESDLENIEVQVELSNGTAGYIKSMPISSGTSSEVTLVHYQDVGGTGAYYDYSAFFVYQGENNTFSGISWDGDRLPDYYFLRTNIKTSCQSVLINAGKGMSAIFLLFGALIAVLIVVVFKNPEMFNSKMIFAFMGFILAAAIVGTISIMVIQSSCG